MHFKMKRPKDSHKVGVTILLAIVEPLCFYELIKGMIRIDCQLRELGFSGLNYLLNY